MAGRKSSRSSKTDHVLSLLSQSSPQEPAQADLSTPVPASETPLEPAQPPAAESSAADGAAAVPAMAEPPAAASAAPAGQRLSPPILEVARTNNEALEETIHQALEAALEESISAEAALKPEPPQPEPGDPEPVPVPEPEPESVPEPEPEPAAESPSPAEAQPPQEPAAEAVPELRQPAASLPAAAPADPFVLTVLPDGARLVNVMEHLVEEKVEHYAKLFHLCCCPRCLADSTALALSRLPAKYVVLTESAYRPMMSFYEAKFDSMVTAQIIYACKQVLESPRHDL